jgi:predicted nucleic acid-binding protein
VPGALDQPPGAARVPRHGDATPARPSTAADGRSDRAVEGFEQDFNVAEDGPEVFAELRRLLTGVPIAGKQVHDANLVATMLAHGITRLLTFNAADFRRFGSLVELVPP